MAEPPGVCNPFNPVLGSARPTKSFYLRMRQQKASFSEISNCGHGSFGIKKLCQVNSKESVNRISGQVSSGFIPLHGNIRTNSRELKDLQEAMILIDRNKLDNFNSDFNEIKAKHGRPLYKMYGSLFHLENNEKIPSKTSLKYSNSQHGINLSSNRSSKPIDKLRFKSAVHNFVYQDPEIIPNESMFSNPYSNIESAIKSNIDVKINTEIIISDNEPQKTGNSSLEIDNNRLLSLYAKSECGVKEKDHLQGQPSNNNFSTERNNLLKKYNSFPFNISNCSVDIEQINPSSSSIVSLVDSNDRLGKNSRKREHTDLTVIEDISPSHSKDHSIAETNIMQRTDSVTDNSVHILVASDAKLTCQHREVLPPVVMNDTYRVLISQYNPAERPEISTAEQESTMLFSTENEMIASHSLQTDSNDVTPKITSEIKSHLDGNKSVSTTNRLWNTVQNNDNGLHLSLTKTATEEEFDTRFQKNSIADMDSVLPVNEEDKNLTSAEISFDVVEEKLKDDETAKDPIGSRSFRENKMRFNKMMKHLYEVLLKTDRRVHLCNFIFQDIWKSYEVAPSVIPSTSRWNFMKRFNTSLPLILLTEFEIFTLERNIPKLQNIFLRDEAWPLWVPDEIYINFLKVCQETGLKLLKHHGHYTKRIPDSPNVELVDDEDEYNCYDLYVSTSPEPCLIYPDSLISELIIDRSVEEYRLNESGSKKHYCIDHNTSSTPELIRSIWSLLHRGQIDTVKQLVTGKKLCVSDLPKSITQEIHRQWSLSISEDLSLRKQFRQAVLKFFCLARKSEGVECNTEPNENTKLSEGGMLLLPPDVNVGFLKYEPTFPSKGFSKTMKKQFTTKSSNSAKAAKQRFQRNEGFSNHHVLSTKIDTKEDDENYGWNSNSMISPAGGKTSLFSVFATVANPHTLPMLLPDIDLETENEQFKRSKSKMKKRTIEDIARERATRIKNILKALPETSLYRTHSLLEQERLDGQAKGSKKKTVPLKRKISQIDLFQKHSQESDISQVSVKLRIKKKTFPKRKQRKVLHRKQVSKVEGRNYQSTGSKRMTGSLPADFTMKYPYEWKTGPPNKASDIVSWRISKKTSNRIEDSAQPLSMWLENIINSTSSVSPKTRDLDNIENTDVRKKGDLTNKVKKKTTKTSRTSNQIHSGRTSSMNPNCRHHKIYSEYLDCFDDTLSEAGISQKTVNDGISPLTNTDMFSSPPGRCISNREVFLKMAEKMNQKQIENRKNKLITGSSVIAEVGLQQYSDLSTTKSASKKSSSNSKNSKLKEYSGKNNKSFIVFHQEKQSIAKPLRKNRENLFNRKSRTEKPDVLQMDKSEEDFNSFQIAPQLKDINIKYQENGLHDGIDDFFTECSYLKDLQKDFPSEEYSLSKMEDETLISPNNVICDYVISPTVCDEAERSTESLGYSSFKVEKELPHSLPLTNTSESSNTTTNSGDKTVSSDRLASGSDSPTSKTHKEESVKKSARNERLSKSKKSAKAKKKDPATKTSPNVKDKSKSNKNPGFPSNKNRKKPSSQSKSKKTEPSKIQAAKPKELPKKTNTKGKSKGSAKKRNPKIKTKDPEEPKTLPDKDNRNSSKTTNEKPDKKMKKPVAKQTKSKGLKNTVSKSQANNNKATNAINVITEKRISVMSRTRKSVDSKKLSYSEDVPSEKYVENIQPRLCKKILEEAEELQKKMNIPKVTFLDSYSQKKTSDDSYCFSNDQTKKTTLFQEDPGLQMAQDICGKSRESLIRNESFQSHTMLKQPSDLNFLYGPYRSCSFREDQDIVKKRIESSFYEENQTSEGRVCTDSETKRISSNYVQKQDIQNSSNRISVSPTSIKKRALSSFCSKRQNEIGSCNSEEENLKAAMSRLEEEKSNLRSNKKKISSLLKLARKERTALGNGYSEYCPLRRSMHDNVQHPSTTNASPKFTSALETDNHVSLQKNNYAREKCFSRVKPSTTEEDKLNTKSNSHRHAQCFLPPSNTNIKCIRPYQAKQFSSSTQPPKSRFQVKSTKQFNKAESLSEVSLCSSYDTVEDNWKTLGPNLQENKPTLYPQCSSEELSLDRSTLPVKKGSSNAKIESLARRDSSLTSRRGKIITQCLQLPETSKGPLNNLRKKNSQVPNWYEQRLATYYHNKFKPKKSNPPPVEIEPPHCNNIGIPNSDWSHQQMRSSAIRFLCVIDPSDTKRYQHYLLKNTDSKQQEVRQQTDPNSFWTTKGLKKLSRYQTEKG